MATNAATSGFPIDWSALKAFIADKEDYEQKNGHPAPLTDSQRDAINILVPPTRPPINPASDDKINWIGMLNEWLQKSKCDGSLGFSEQAVMVPRQSGKGGEIFWRCVCELPAQAAALNTFPRAGYGTNAGDLPPIFIRKQDAKKFSARMACEYLAANKALKLPPGVTPQKRPAPSSPPAPARPAPSARTGFSPDLKPAVDNTEQQPGTTQNATAPAANISIKANQGEQKTAAVDVSGSPSTPSNAVGTVSLVKEVSDLSQQLGLPAPRYHVEESADSGSWNGRCDFGFHPKVPNGLGTVTGASSTKIAKEAMAKLVLDWMKALHAERSELSRKLAEAES